MELNREDVSCLEQRTPEWYKARLGHITGSMVYNVMLQPTKKAMAEGEIFSETAKSYLYKVASERNIRKSYLEDDFRFAEYLERTNIETREMRYGSETEAVAREAYRLKTKCELTEVGFVQHKSIDNYGDSPDGVVLDKETFKPIGCIEIKCPKPETWMKYKALFAQGKSLLDIEEKYYWQCLSHIMCLEVDWCDFIYFDKMMKDSLQVVRIDRNDEDILALEQRIEKANEFINSLLV
jgi:hypothetical protein